MPKSFANFIIAMNIICHEINVVTPGCIEQLIEQLGENFERQYFTSAERKIANLHPNHIQYFSGRYAAKKVVLKILNQELNQEFLWQEIEILRQHTGKPSVLLHGRCQEIAAALGIQIWFVTISHTSSHAVASAIAIGDIPQLFSVSF
jgi:holo-[acyl-carrier protein] synthase